MNALFLLAAAPSTASLVQLLIYVAVACVVIWAIIALIRWSGIVIPQPVWIILTALFAILCILFIAKVFGLVV
jgi:hypothetical protein